MEKQKSRREKPGGLAVCPVIFMPEQIHGFAPPPRGGFAFSEEKNYTRKRRLFVPYPLFSPLFYQKKTQNMPACYGFHGMPHLALVQANPHSG